MVDSGDAGYDAIEAQMPNNQADAWLDAHGQRALRALPAYKALAVLAVVACGRTLEVAEEPRHLNGLTLAFTLFDFGLGGWIGYAGGRAMHKEFRTGTPTEPVGGYVKMR